MRDVGFLYGGGFLRRQLERQGSDRVVQVVELRGADDRRGDERFLQQPGERDLSPGYSSLFCDLAGPVDDAAVGAGARGIELFAELIGLQAAGALLPIAREASAGERAPGQYAD